MSTSSKPAKRYHGTITPIDTGVFEGEAYVSNKSGSRRFVFHPTAKGLRHHPVFAITDSEFTVLKWVGPKADKARAHYAA